VSRIRVGAPVDVTVATLGKTFRGIVARSAGKLDGQTRTMSTEVDVKNPTLELLPGMYATAILTLAERKAALTVPVQAVDRTETKASVLLVDASRTLRPRDIKLGLETPDKVEVLSGLAEHDLVVVGNRSQLKAGATVAPKLQEGAGAPGEK
jgi:multidrug efflux pump subunit AcrA (membrane-fusion protein)